MATLLLLSTPGGKLTYGDGDIIIAQEVGVSPGSAVEANVGDHWSFIVITDKSPSDPEVLDLLTPQVTGTGEDEVQVAKRGKAVSGLPGWPSGSYYNYPATIEDATAQQTMTWQVFSAKVGSKGGN